MSTHPVKPIIALGVRNTVVLYDALGKDIGELRAVGRGRVTCVSFCTAPALFHLLGVGTSAGSVRVIDWEAKRVFCIVSESGSSPIFSLYFLQRYGNVLVVMRKNGVVEWLKYEDSPNVKSYKWIQLGIGKVTCVDQAVVADKTEVAFIGGECQDGSCSIYAVHLWKMDFVHCWNGEGLCNIAYGLRTEFVNALSKQLDGYTAWTEAVSFGDLAVVMSALRVDASRVEPSPEDRNGKAVRKQYRRCMLQCTSSRIAITDKKGTISIWDYSSGNDGELKEVFTIENAHLLQVLALKPVRGIYGVSFVSISMDRTMATWGFQSERGTGELFLRFRSARTNGPVRCLSCSSSRRNDIPSNQEDNNVLVSFSTRDIISILELDSDGQRKAVREEIRPFAFWNGEVGGNAVMSVKCTHLAQQEGEESLSEYILLVGLRNGRIGVNFSGHDRLEYNKPKKRKRSPDWHKTNAFEILTYVPQSHHAVSISGSGILYEWEIIRDQVKKKSQGYEHGKPQLEKQFHLSACFRDHVGIAAFCVNVAREFTFMVCFYNGCIAELSSCGHVLTELIPTEVLEVSCICNLSGTRLIALGTKRGSVCCLRIPTGDELQEITLEGPSVSIGSDSIQTLLWAPHRKDSRSEKFDVYLAVKTVKGDVYVLECEDNLKLKLLVRIKGHMGRISCMDWENENVIITGGEDGSIRRWDITAQPRAK